MASDVFYLLAVAGTLILSLIPAASLDPGAERVARWIYRRDGPRQRRLRANLRIALGPQAGEPAVDSAAAAAYGSYGRYMIEFFTMGWPDFWRRRSRIVRVDVRPLEAALAQGKGAVLFGAHGGNWDLAGAECARSYGAFHSAAEAVRPEWLGRLASRIRFRAGITLYDANAAGRPLVRALRSGQTVGLVCDRVVIGDGVDVMLCGHKAKLPKGPVALAIMTGAPLIPTAMERQANGDIRVELLPPIDLSDLGRGQEDLAKGVQRMADQLTILIGRGYRSWYALQPIWDEATGG